MITIADLHKRRRQVYIFVVLFFLVSGGLCLGSYLGWFGWFIWGRPNPPPKPVVAEGSEAEEFIKRLMTTEAKFARDDLKKLREQLRLMNLVKDARYKKYSDEFQFKLKEAPEPLSNLGVANPKPEEEMAAKSDLENQDILELYGTARLLDKRIHDVYRIFRTCELARIQHISLQEAYDATDVVAPEHPDVDPALFRARITTTDSDLVREIKTSLSSIKVEIKSIVGSATRMLDLAAILEPGLLGVGSEWDFASGQADQMYRTTALIDRPDQMFDGQTGTDPNAFEHEWGRGEGPITKKDLGLAIELGLDLSQTMPLPGRKLLKRGPKDQWMFINSWFVIGPFPNPGRVNLTQKFPPETSIDPRLGFVGIDLDAKYVGADKKTVRWQFLATDRLVCFIPHQPMDWAIWYAYTEIWSEDDMEKFCIFGSDDYGKCWINGETKYDSGITPHPWVPDRKYAKVQFRRGFNPVLFKLENAWGRTGFSMCIYTGEVATDG
jgi:hypothetical protein